MTTTLQRPWPKSKAGCERQINAILNSYRRDYAGGGSFGYDWSTFKINLPERYERVKALQSLWHELPFTDGTRLAR